MAVQSVDLKVYHLVDPWEESKAAQLAAPSVVLKVDLKE
jgi:hypothetical protein